MSTDNDSKNMSNLLSWKPEAQLGTLVASTVSPIWLEQLGQNPDAIVEIDLSEVVGIDTTGLKSLVNLVEAAHNGKASKVRINLNSPTIANMLILVSLDLLCEIKDNSTQPTN